MSNKMRARIHLDEILCSDGETIEIAFNPITHEVEYLNTLGFLTKKKLDDNTSPDLRHQQEQDISAWCWS